MSEARKPLRDVKNFGPVTLAEFEAMGIFYLDQIEELGFEETCRRWVENFPERLNANAFLSIVCVLDSTVWTQATPTQRARAHNLVSEMKSELGVSSPVKKKRKIMRRKN